MKSYSILFFSAFALASSDAYAADVTFSSSATFTDTQTYDNGTISGYRTDVALNAGSNYTFNGNFFVQGAWNRFVLNSEAAMSVSGTLSVDMSGVSLNGGTLTTGEFKVHDAPNWDGALWDGRQWIERGDSVVNGSTIIASQSNPSFISRAISPDWDGVVGNSLWLNGDGATIDSNGFDIGITMNLVGGGPLTKIGAGTLSIAANNTRNGNTTLTTGTLEITPAGKLHGGGYTAAPTITLGSGTLLKLNGWDYDAFGSLGALDFSRDRLVVNGGTIEYVGASNSTIGGAAGRNFTVGTGGATLKASSAPGDLWFIAANTLFGYGNLVNNESLTLDGSGNGEIQKVIEGSGSITKTGSGTWTLSGANTYTGTTSVNGGTLSLTSPSLDSSSSVVIGSSGVLNLNFTGNDVVSALEINGSGPLAAGAYNASHPTYGSFFSGSGSLLVVNGADGSWTSLVDGDWEEPANWAGNTIAVGFNKTATFNAASGATVTLTGALTIGNLAFDVSDYTIAGAPLLLDSSGTPFVDVTSGRTATITTNIDGFSGLEKTGAGSLVLTGANIFSGETRVTEGELQLGASPVSNPEFGALENSNQLTIEAGATVRAMGANAFKGFSGGSMNVAINGGTLVLNDGVTGGGNHVLGFVDLAGGTIAGVGGSFYGGFNLGNTVEVTEDSTISATNTNTLGAARTIVVSAGKTLDWSGTVIDFIANNAPSSLVFEGAGTTVLSGANAYTGNTTINEGTVEVSSTGSLLFRPTTNGTTNSVSGSPTATLSFQGTVNLDLGTTDGTDGNAWTLFSLSSYAGLAPAAVTSTLGSFSEPTSGTWELAVIGAKWVFTEADGILSYVVTATDYDTWETANGVTGGPDDDDDNDGLTNSDEYAFGLDPTGGSSVNPIAVPLDKTTGTFSYTRRTQALTGLSYSIWYSTDLASWTEDTGAVEGTPSVSGEVETVPVTISGALLSNTKLFIQVRAE